MIENLILKGYNRFFLNNIEEIDYTPKSPIQLILGSNGSGKSSLLKELNPLPIDKHEFKEDGYKFIKRTKDNNVYEIYSDKSKCSFKKNGEELNPGGTKKIQLSLVEDHFNLTPKSNNVILGIDKLTNMSTNVRKEWLRQMSTVDYAYSIYLYNEFKQKLRDSVGFIKIINNELTADTNMLIKEEEIAGIEKEIKFLKDHIEFLTTRYDNRSIKDIDIEKRFIDLNAFKELISNGYNKLNLESLTEEFNILTYTIKDLDKELEEVIKEIDNIEIFTKSTEEIVKLKEDKEILEEYFKEIETKFPKAVINFMDSIDLVDIYNNIEASINKHIIDISYYDDIRLEKDLYSNTNNLREASKNKLNTLTKKHSNLETEIKILEDNHKDENKVICSKCGNIEHFGYDDNKYHNLKDMIKKLEDEIEIVSKEFEEINTLFGKINNKINIIKSLRDIFITSNLSDFWINSLRDNIGVISSNELSIINSNLKAQIISTKNFKQYKTEYDEIIYKIKLDNEILLNQEKYLTNTKEKLMDKLTTIQDLKRVKQVELDNKKMSIENIKRFNVLKSYFETTLKNYGNNILSSNIKGKNYIIRFTINCLKEEMLILEEKYNNYDRLKSRIDKNKELIEKHEANKVCYEKIIKALSPTEGLIAKSINSFINKFLLEMNTIINSVWSYDITLLPCQINEDNDLDYKFSVLVDNNQTIDDVSKLSSSMKDIIDLSFRIVFMKYMHLTEEPLILDEFGITMDDKHRYNVYNVIENTLANNFTQMFITAHFKSMYSRFLESDIIVLDDKNIELDKTSYNVNIKIK